MTNSMLRQALRILIGLSLMFTYSSAFAARFDVLVLYIDAATQTNNGRDIAARAASYIEYTNQAYRNSGVNSELRLVGLERLNADYRFVNSSNLSQFAGNTEVQRLRQQYGADMVTLLNLRENVSGGYVCGIAYIGSGSASQGRFYSGAARSAYSLVGVDCGLSTFAHELGHNQGLGHSYAQNSTGGVWPWARGHGVQGSFATIMAYPQSYGTRNQLQRFSNPAQTACAGQPCGRDINAVDGADATSNLNRLADQIAAWVPQVTTGPSPTPSPTPSPSATPTRVPTPSPLPSPTSVPSPQPSPTPVVLCPNTPVEGNLLTNAHMDTLEGWRDLFNSSRLTLGHLDTGNCRESVLWVRERGAYYSGAYADTTSTLAGGQEYRLRAELGLANTRDRANVRAAVRVVKDGRTTYQYLPSLSVTANELSPYDAVFNFETSGASATGIVFFGPDAGVELLVDKVSLVPVGNTPSEPTEVSSHGFELDARGWAPAFTTTLAYSATAYAGSYSLVSYNRSSVYSGPYVTLTGLIAGAQVYSLDAQVRVSSSSSAERVVFYASIIDGSGQRWQKLADTTVNSGEWTRVYEDFTIDVTGNLEEISIYVMGPRASANLYLDEFKILE